MDSLVSTTWLGGALRAGDIALLDASWFLPEHGRNARREFAEAHLPGARFLDLDPLHDVPEPPRFAEMMGALGVADDMRIVVYDNSPLHSAARAWWLLRHFGARRVAILDGGVAKWRGEGRAVASGEGAHPTPKHFVARPGGDSRDKAQLLANLASGAEQVIDARSPSRFAGREAEPRAGVAPGHIPGARNLHYATLFAEDGSWKSGVALERAFDTAGADPARTIVATCGSGVTAGVIAFAAHLLGREAALYDGSWAEWGSDPATPKATGA